MKRSIVYLVLLFIVSSRSMQRVILLVVWGALEQTTSIGGLYSPILREYYCSSEDSCKHERGHMEDNALWWYSRTEAFKYQIDVIANCQAPGLPYLPYIQLYLREWNDPVEEVYAYIYGIVDLDEFSTLPELLEYYAGICVIP